MNDKDKTVEIKNKILSYIPLLLVISRVVLLIVGFFIIITNGAFEGITYLVISTLIYYINSIINSKLNIPNKIAIAINKVTDLLFILLGTICILNVNNMLVLIPIGLEIIYILILILYRLSLNKWQEILTGGKVKTAFLFVTLMILTVSKETTIFEYYSYAFIVLTGLTQIWAITGALKLYSMDKKTASIN